MFPVLKRRNMLCGSCDRHTIQMKAIEEYFPVELFVMLYTVVLTVSVGEIL